LKLFRNKTISVPKDLSTIISYNPEDEVSPENVDMATDDVNSIWNGVEKYYRSGVQPGISLCIRRHGKIILNRAIGFAKGNGPDDGPDVEKVPITPDTPICQFSASKAVTAMLIHSLVEKGLINLTDPVSHHIPEFGMNGKEDITIFNVLAHRSGFPSPPKSANTDILFNFDDTVKLICDLEPKYPSGHTTAYHAITSGFILGEIIKRKTGKSIREFLAETIQKPLGFRYFNYGVPEEEIDNVALNYATGLPVVFPFSMIINHSLGKQWEEIIQISNEKRFLEAIIPSANLVATANEISQFFQLLLNMGELNGKRIFDPLSIKRATIEAGKMQFDKTMVLLPMRYSPGLMLGSDPISLFGPFTKKAFGHWGFFNSFSWADPERAIAVSLLTTGKAFIGTYLIDHFRLISLISKHCKKIEETPI